MACGRTTPEARGRFATCRRAAALILLLLLALVGPSRAAPLKATLSVTTADGYARLVFTAGEYIDGSVHQGGNVLIISFKEPLDLSVARVADQADGYIGAARLDPDGKAVRFALEQDVTVHAMPAGEKYFVDLLPKSWTGVPPGLPQDVVDDLAKRAREAETLLRRQHAAQEQEKPPIRVHVAAEPTFTRYVFDLPARTAVSANRGKDRLVLDFDAPLKFDLADADASLPKGVAEISSEVDGDTALVRFVFAAKVDVRTFRDDSGYAVDVIALQPNAGDAPGTKPAASPAAANGNAGGALSLAAAVDKIAAAAVVPAAVAPAPVSLPATTAPAAVPPINSAANAPANPSPAPLAAKPNPPAPAAKPDQAPPAPTVAAAPPVSKPNEESPRAQAAEKTAPPPASGLTKLPASPPATKNAVAAPAVAAPAPAASATTPPAPSHDAAKPATHHDSLAADVAEQGGDLKIAFAFKTPVGAAVFRRADTLWIVFDSQAEIDLSALDREPSHTIRKYTFTQSGGADVVRLKLDRPQLASVAANGPVWTVQLGETVLEPTGALDLAREAIGPNRASVTVALAAQEVHRLADPEIGDDLFVVTALGPPRGLLDGQDFVEFHAFASTQGIVIEPLADDLTVTIAGDKVVIARPAGLTLSNAAQSLLHGDTAQRATSIFDTQAWGSDGKGSYFERESHLVTAAADAPLRNRLVPRLDLARFYVARGMYPEAKGVLDVTLSDQRTGAATDSALVLRAVAEVMMNRPDAALKDLAEPGVGDRDDAPLWRALALAKQGKWAEAREAFKAAAAAVATLPVELQRVALKDEMRSAIEVRDFANAADDLNDFQVIGIPHAMQPALAVLMGRLAEGLNRKDEALGAYRTAADSWDRAAAAQGQLRETMLRYRLGDLKRADVISQLESLTTIWRGDETEIEALKVLAHLYTEDGRYRDAFYVMRSAMAARPGSALTRQIQDEAATTFDSLFLSNKGDAMPAIDALALFYDFRELTPIGPRGDEMIRRLADRLVAVDLLDQAAELLQYQVDRRLQGAARAQVATRLAVVYLMDRKPDRALAVLRGSRTGELSNTLRDQRLLIEARSLSELGRHDLALEVVGDLSGRAVMRLRADILWAAHRWDKSAGEIELMYGNRFKDFRPLDADERQDIMRAAIGYALADDTLGLGRFREKYAAKMAATPDAHDFDLVSAPLGASADGFAAIAHEAAATDTLETFLHDMRTAYPDSAVLAPPGTTAPAPAPSDAPSVAAEPPQTRPAAPDIMPVPPPAAAGRTAMR